MPSSSRPYKSKLLRFVLQQWQQGLERQDQAWRRVQSTATWGAQVAIFPIYAIMRSVKRASFTLGSDTQPSQRAEPSMTAKGNVTDITHSLTAILTYTQQRLSPEQTSQLALEPEKDGPYKAPSFLAKVASRVQRKLFPAHRRSSSNALSQAKHRSGDLKSLREEQQLSNTLTTAYSSPMQRRISTDLFQNGTTLASSLKTQRLVLVNPSNKVFDIFTSEQQTELKHYIDRIMEAYQRLNASNRGTTKLKQAKSRLQAGNVTDTTHSLTAVLTYTQQRLSLEQTSQLALALKKGGLVRKAQSFLAKVANRAQQQLFSTHGRSSATALSKVQRQASDLTSLRKNQRQSGRLTTIGSGLMQERMSTDLLQNGTTLASSIKNQRLLLVNPRNETFDIFTPEQQTDLKHYISRIMQAYQHSRTMVPHQAKSMMPHQTKTMMPNRAKPLSAKTIWTLGTVFITALPAEFTRAWSQIAPSSPSLPPLKNNGPQPRTRVFYPSLSTADTVKIRGRRLSSNGATRRLSSNSPHAFEADVQDVSYLEHPLEKVLRWIDRILTWCEHRWQQWLEGRANIG